MLKHKGWVGGDALFTAAIECSTSDVDEKMIYGRGELEGTAGSSETLFQLLRQGLVASWDIQGISLVRTSDREAIEWRKTEINTKWHQMRDNEWLGLPT